MAIILAIRGHEKRYREVIALLEMLGARNDLDLTGNNDKRIYYISSCGYIDYCCPDKKYSIYTLKQFYKKFPYKVGNRVKTVYGSSGKVYAMQWIDDEIQYRLDFGHHTSGWYVVDELQPYKEETMEGKLISNEKMSLKIDISQMEKRQIIFSADAPDETELVLGDNYEIKVEDGKTYVVRKKPQYPKTYKENCNVLGLDTMDNDAKGYKHELIIRFQELLIARDAYWKIAGEQMGLGKPWEPDWKSSDLKYVIKTMGDEICESTECTINCFLAFPTEEMRDEYKNNFDAQIKFCKEYL